MNTMKLKFLDRLLNAKANPDDLQDTEVPPQAIDIALNTNERSAVRFGLTVLVVAFGGFFLWAALAPLDAGVSSPGVVTVEGKRKTIQHLRGGIVKDIFVREGDTVKAGQPLIKLDETQIRAELGVLKSQYLVALAMRARLLAERDNQPRITFPQELQEEKQDTRAAESMATQTQLFQSRRAAHTSEIGMLNESIAGTSEQLKALQAMEKSKAEQLSLLKQELDSLRDLAKEGYVPRNRLFELERNVAMINGSRSEDIGNIGRTKNAIAQLKLQILQRQQEFRKEVEGKLTEVQAQVDGLRDRLTASEADLERATLRSPADGIVVGSNVHTIGGIVTPADKLMDIVPGSETLVVEAQVMTNMIAHVHAGAAADIHFTALNQRTTPVIPGKVVTVSADRLTDQRSGMPYYMARVEVTAEGIKKLGNEKISPGMPAEVVIKTGERTLLNYLIKPLLDRTTSAFTEQ